MPPLLPRAKVVHRAVNVGGMMFAVMQQPVVTVIRLARVSERGRVVHRSAAADVLAVNRQQVRPLRVAATAK